MFKRKLAAKILKSAKKYPVISILGPRQSGKTTLVKELFKKYHYVSLENPSDLSYATGDPEGFLMQYSNRVIIDEVQKVPKLFSYIQGIVDEKQKPGMFILTGSQNFELLENITQSLAGRVSIEKLLPLSLEELTGAGVAPPKLEKILYTGGYPRIYDKKIPPSDWLANYVITYLERDVRSMKNIGSLSTFHKFLKMCAARSGKILNLSSLANDCGITHNTAKEWVSILEASFIAFLVQPHYKNFNKRLIKAPKLYFYDTGLLCYLLGILSPKRLMTHQDIGAIFETFVVSELLKNRLNLGLPPNLYFWQDKSGKEVDCLLDMGDRIYPVEIKAGQTVASDYFNNLNLWNKLSGSDPAASKVVYAGNKNQKRSSGSIVGWKELIHLNL